MHLLVLFFQSFLVNHNSLFMSFVLSNLVMKDLSTDIIPNINWLTSDILLSFIIHNAKIFKLMN